MKQLFFIYIALLGMSAFATSQEEVQKKFLEIDARPATHTETTQEERQKIFDLASHNPVASLNVLSKYDPTGEIGFCFGRAMTVHLVSRNLGLDKNSIKKLFIVGDMRSGSEPEWRFHVTTLVQGTDKKWYAIDPIMTPPLGHSKPLLMHEWMQIVQKTWDKHKKARFYVVSNNTVIPDLRIVPETNAEKGEHLIEISFETEKHNGFEKKKNSVSDYYLVSPEAEEIYFTEVKEKKVEDEFPLLEMAINGHIYKFNNYFADLMESLLKVDEKLISK